MTTRTLLPGIALSVLVGAALAQDSLNVRLVGRCGTPRYGFGVAVGEGWAYVADLTSRLRVITVSDPSHAVEVGYCDTRDGALGVAVSGEYAYVADGDSGLRVVKVDDPANPVEVGHCYTPGYALAGAVAGDHVYVADLYNGLRVISVADPSSPVEVGGYESPGFACGVAVSGEYAYVASDSAGLRIISVADPANPVEVGFYDTPGNAVGVAVSGSRAYVADGRSGLRVISVADPAHPEEIGFCGTPSRASAVAVYDGSREDMPWLRPNCAYVTDEDSGLRVISVVDPSRPVEVGFHHTPGLALGVATDGGYAHVVDSDAGLLIYEFFSSGVEEAPDAEARATNLMPTVVRGTLTLCGLGTRSGLPDNPGMSRAALLDAAGRKVMDLKAGANDVSTLSPGVYFIREAHAQAQAQAVRKVVITK